MSLLRRGIASSRTSIPFAQSQKVCRTLPATCPSVPFSTSTPPNRHTLLSASVRCRVQTLGIPQFSGNVQSRLSSHTPVVDEGDRVTKFSELGERGLVNQRIIDRLTKGMGIEQMTDVQSLTISATLNGTDTYARFLQPRAYTKAPAEWLKHVRELERRWLS